MLYKAVDRHILLINADEMIYSIFSEGFPLAEIRPKLKPKPTDNPQNNWVKCPSWGRLGLGFFPPQKHFRK